MINAIFKEEFKDF